MEVLLDQTSTSGRVTPLYQVKDGICQDSLGVQCAERIGLPQTITERAREVVSQQEDDLQILQCIRQNVEIPLHPDLMMISNPEKMEGILRDLFSVQDWKRVSKEELATFLQKIASL